MQSVIIKPKNELLKKHIQYFLFFNKTNVELLNYTTFPNNNLCLAIYKENNVSYSNQANSNNCLITDGNNSITSRFYGFHRMPFTVDVNSSLDQICIVFNPSALRAFTQESYADLMHSDNFFDIFFYKDSSVLEQIFEEIDFSKRADILEHLLLTNLNYEVPNKLTKALHIITRHSNENLKVEDLAKALEISTSTLFRLFKNHLGQNPKSYLNTIRFRNSLNEILENKNTLTSIAHYNEYYDQAHFINDFKTFSGHSPKQLYDRISVQQNDLAWIYNKK